MQGNFFGYQHQRFLLLLGWGLLSVITGGALQRNAQSFWKQFGLQSLLWGAIDAALALFGIVGADKKGKRYILGQLDTTDEQKEARTFYRILLINTGLDVGYVALGIWLMQRFQARADRRGMGLGILIQGLWLFLFDGLVSQEVRARWKL
jgi:hypothetical protein